MFAWGRFVGVCRSITKSVIHKIGDYLVGVLNQVLGTYFWDVSSEMDDGEGMPISFLPAL